MPCLGAALCCKINVLRQFVGQDREQGTGEPSAVDIFISWSGERSKYVAGVLRTWLPRVIQAVKPWMSDHDIASGTRWSSSIATQLSVAAVGIICVTPENQNSAWLMFEAGAISKHLSNARVCPLLIGMRKSELVGPLAQFQAAEADSEGVRHIVRTLNSALDSDAMAMSEVDEIYGVWWPQLSERLSDIPTYGGPVTPARTADDMLAEILDNTRESKRIEELRLERLKADSVELGEMQREMRRSFEAHIKSVTEMDGKMKDGFGFFEGLASTLNTDKVEIDFAKLREMMSTLSDGPSKSFDFGSIIAQLKNLEQVNASGREFTQHLLEEMKRGNSESNTDAATADKLK